MLNTSLEFDTNILAKMGFSIDEFKELTQDKNKKQTTSKLTDSAYQTFISLVGQSDEDEAPQPLKASFKPQYMSTKKDLRKTICFQDEPDSTLSSPILALEKSVSCTKLQTINTTTLPRTMSFSRVNFGLGQSKKKFSIEQSRPSAIQKLTIRIEDL